jgi:hypothetical protein
MRPLFFTIIATLLFSNIAYGQSQGKASEKLYMPLEFKKAYEAGTRDKSGKVPENYWQNRSKYVIKASLDPKTRLLEGKAKIKYFNNSPDSLLSIVFQAYHDYLKPDAKRKYFIRTYQDEIEDHKGFEIKQLIVENDTINVNNSPRIKYGGTNYEVSLKNPVPGGDSIELYVEWNYVEADSN